MEFKDYVRIVLSHWVGVLVLAILGLVAALGYNATQPKVYQASSTGLVTVGRTADTSAATIGDQLAKNRVTSYVSIATSTEVADKVVASHDLDGTDLPQSAGALIGQLFTQRLPQLVVVA